MQHAFPSTRWSRILGGSGARDLEALAQAYWRPVRAWLRARLVLSEDDAADLAQDAFAWMLASGLLDRADPARGSFRAFLKTALANFATGRLRHDAAQKRGGGQAAMPLDAAMDVADPGARTPDQELDDAWRRELLEQARQRLQQELEATGRGTYWLVFRDWFLDASAADHAELASRHGISRTAVSNWLDHGKRRYRALLRELVADTVTDEADLQQELRWLFGPVRGGGDGS